MKLNELWNEYYKLPDNWEDETFMDWINKLLAKDSNNIDYRHVYLQLLLDKGSDAEWEQEEPVFSNFCTSIIKDKDQHKPITVAKAYCYRGDIKYYAIDRRKDFDKAMHILKGLNQNDREVEYLKKIVELKYPLHVRDYLPIDRNYMDMFKI